MITNSGTCILAIFLIVILCFVVCAFGIALIIYSNKHKEILENLTKYEIDVGAQIDESIPKLLELFVQSTFTDYQAKNLVDIMYIDSEKEQEIIDELSKICGNQISPALINKLSLFWNPEKIGSVIADKVYLTVVAFVASNNAVHYDDGKPV